MKALMFLILIPCVCCSEGTCPICFEEMLSHNTTMLYCGHKFHKDCITEVLLRTGLCPYCRKIALRHTGINDTDHSQCKINILQALVIPSHLIYVHEQFNAPTITPWCLGYLSMTVYATRYCPATTDENEQFYNEIRRLYDEKFNLLTDAEYSEFELGLAQFWEDTGLVRRDQLRRDQLCRDQLCRDQLRRDQLRSEQRVPQEMPPEPPQTIIQDICNICLVGILVFLFVIVAL